MRCIVTAGPTFEPLDQVRRLTNFSTGRLGTGLAAHLARADHEVTLLRGSLATFPDQPPGVQIRAFTTTDDLGAQLKGLGTSERVAVFHAAAVNDFGFGAVFERGPSGDLVRVAGGKISTRRGALLVELKPVPKLIRSLRDWFPSARLVGWKYEVDGAHADAIAEGRRQLLEARTDACVVNGPAYGAGFAVVPGTGVEKHCESAAGLFDTLERMIKAG